MGKQTKITKSAREQDCLVRIPGVCNRNPETVIFAHKNGGGMGMKSPDIHGAYCCSSCHDAYDGRLETGWPPMELHLCFYEGIFRTQLSLVGQGLIETR